MQKAKRKLTEDLIWPSEVFYFKKTILDASFYSAENVSPCQFSTKLSLALLFVFSSSQATGKINSSTETIAAFSTMMRKYLDKDLT